MLVVDDKNARVVKDLRFMLWSFLDATINLPMEESIKLFGHHTTYRYCSNIELGKLDPKYSGYEYNKLLLENPNVNNREIARELGEGALAPLHNHWERLLADPYLSCTAGVRLNTHMLRLSTATPGLVNKVLRTMAMENEEPLMELTRTIFALPKYFDTPSTIISEISIRYPSTYLDALVLTANDIRYLVESGYYRKPRVASLILANGGLDVWDEVKEFRQMPIWMGANDALNVGIDMGRELTNWDRWRHQSIFNPITRDVESGVIELVFKSTNPERFMYLGNFDSENQLTIISKLLEDPSVDINDINHLCYCLLALMQTKVQIPDATAETISAWAIGTGESRHLWRLYLADNMPEQIRENLEVYLKNNN